MMEQSKQDLSEFYGIYNTMFKYIYKTYGKEGYDKYLTFIAESYFDWLIKDIKKEGLQAVKKYWFSTCENDNIKYKHKFEKNKFELIIEKCSAIDYLRKNNQDIFTNYCEHCEIVNKHISKLSNINYRISFGNELGCCKHIFMKGN